MRWMGVLFLAVVNIIAANRPPAADRFPVRGPDGGAILPGGRVIEPVGRQFPTGPGALGIAVSPSGRSIATANIGPERASITIMEEDRQGEWALHNIFGAGELSASALLTSSGFSNNRDFRSLSGGIAFQNEKQVWITDGQSGQVRLIDTAGGAHKRILDLDGPGVSHSFSSALAYGASRNLLYVLDQANCRFVVFDPKRGAQIGSVHLASVPFALGLTADGNKAWVAGLGSLSVIGLTQPENPKVEVSLKIPEQTGPSNLLVTPQAVYVSVAAEDVIYRINPATNSMIAEIPIRIPGLENLRGILPLGMAFDPSGQRLLVAEAGLNAVGVIDAKTNMVLGHIPVGWAPQALAVSEGYVFVTNADGRGTGPSSILVQPDGIDFAGVMRRGSVSRFPLPGAPGPELVKQTRLVFAANGLFPAKDLPDLPLPIRDVVLIVKGNSTFDEVFGDVKNAGTPVAGIARLAIFGAAGYASGGKGHFSLQNINITPNQHALAEQFTFSDNFYADSETGVEGYRWLLGEYPFALSPGWTGSPENLWKHLESNGVSFRNFGQSDGPGPLRPPTTDQLRAARFIAELDEKYGKTGQPLPRFLLLSLPNDCPANPDPAHGFPYSASYVADNDTALGKVVDYLSHSPWWREMAIFVTESGAGGGRDHIDAHRTILLGVGPYLKRGYVSHTNAGYPALLKLVFRLLRVPSMNLFDATAANLGDLFGSEANFQPYRFIPTDSHLFDSEMAGGT